MAPLRRPILVLIYSAALLVAMSANAHHSISGQYDPRNPVTVEGTVVEVMLRNPHSRLRMDIADEAGNVQTWTLEMDDVEDMAEQGVTSETLLVGDELVVLGFPARDGSQLLHIERFHRPSDGLVYEED